MLAHIIHTLYNRMSYKCIMIFIVYNLKFSFYIFSSVFHYLDLYINTYYNRTINYLNTIYVHSTQAQ